MPRNAPVLVRFHGGGCTRGPKNREARPLPYRLAGQGWMCVNANYRLRGRTRFRGRTQRRQAPSGAAGR
ncbi:hypothetical protein ACWDTR_20650 [Streptomyces sp. NPDC003470]|uniref:hypothetical protein n=1 Tax=Streptomyces sp. NPDC127100 TaxID=3347138 RepID=UPI00364EDD38